MFIQSAMRLIQQAEIIAAQDYLEAMDPIESPISEDVLTMLARIGKPH
jgi:hypothetical protein